MAIDFHSARPVPVETRRAESLSLPLALIVHVVQGDTCDTIGQCLSDDKNGRRDEQRRASPNASPQAPAAPNGSINISAPTFRRAPSLIDSTLRPPLSYAVQVSSATSIIPDASVDFKSMRQSALALAFEIRSLREQFLDMQMRDHDPRDLQAKKEDIAEKERQLILIGTVSPVLSAFVRHRCLPVARAEQALTLRETMHRLQSERVRLKAERDALQEKLSSTVVDGETVMALYGKAYRETKSRIAIIDHRLGLIDEILRGEMKVSSRDLQILAEGGDINEGSYREAKEAREKEISHSRNKEQYRASKGAHLAARSMRTRFRIAEARGDKEDREMRRALREAVQKEHAIPSGARNRFLGVAQASLGFLGKSAADTLPERLAFTELLEDRLERIPRRAKIYRALGLDDYQRARTYARRLEEREVLRNKDKRRREEERFSDRTEQSDRLSEEAQMSKQPAGTKESNGLDAEWRVIVARKNEELDAADSIRARMRKEWLATLPPSSVTAD